MPELRAAYLGFDESTTKTGVGVRGVEGTQKYVEIDEKEHDRGWKSWKGLPKKNREAFELAKLPDFLLSVLRKLEAAGWQIRGAAGSLSFSVRQHDMVLLGRHDEVLIPALSWRCNAAKRQVSQLRAANAQKTVGPIEERFILPKLKWVLKQNPKLADKLAHIMTTGDWIAYMLTGELSLSTSDALSNGLLQQSDRSLARRVLEKAGLNPDWLPPLVQSGTKLEKTVRREATATGAWGELQDLLSGWKIVACLGDNHATGVGCGGLVDHETIVASAGTSGTINRRVAPSVKLRKPPAGKKPRYPVAEFEFYRDKLLLAMLGDCGQWYRNFRDWYGRGNSYDDLNLLAQSADLDKIIRIEPLNRDSRAKFAKNAAWRALPLAEKTASTQFSIALELLLRVKEMLARVGKAPPVRRFVLTGGVSRGLLLRDAFRVGIEMLAPGLPVQVSAKGDELSYQTAAYGALINAMLPDRHDDLAGTVEALCELKECPAPASHVQAELRSLLAPHLSKRR